MGTHGIILNTGAVRLHLPRFFALFSAVGGIMWVDVITTNLLHHFHAVLSVWVQEEPVISTIDPPQLIFQFPIVESFTNCMAI